MSEIIVDDVGPHTRIRPHEWERIFQEHSKFNGNLADLLLDNEATAVFHVDSTLIVNPEDIRTQHARALLLGVNYHEQHGMGHSEGYHKIVVQNIPERKGPYVLFRPPGYDEDTFYLQDMVFPDLAEPQFQEHVSAPGKIRNY